MGFFRSVAGLSFLAALVGAANVRAAPGERNDLVLTGKVTDFVVTERSSAPLKVGSGCRPLAPQTVRCSTALIPPVDYAGGNGDPDADHVSVELGDRDDRLQVSPGASLNVRADGGSGADVLRGGRANDILIGGSGDDRVFGGDGGDFLGDAIDGAGADPGADVLDGGAGTDSAVYGSRRVSVVVDLARHVGGPHGERDALRSIEDAFGGSAPDVLVGDGHANRLSAGTGPPRRARRRRRAVRRRDARGWARG